MCDCLRGVMRVLTWLIVYYYHGVGSAAFPNYIISVDGPTINTITFIKSVIIALYTETSCYELASKNDMLYCI